MPQRFYNPFPQFLTDTPAVREGARLFFYEAGGATKLDTFPARDLLGSPNQNPIVLNEYGHSPVDIYLQDREYKIVLAPPGSDDPPTSAIWTADYYRPTDFSIVTLRKVGSGNPAGLVAGTAGSAGVLPTEYWDYTGNILYVCTLTGDAANAQWTALNAQSAANTSVPPQGYLSPSSTEAIITADVISATALTYHRAVGDLVPIYNGAAFAPMQLGSDLTLTLHSSHAINTIYDVFVFNNSGVPTLVTGPAWSVSTAGSGARGTGAGTTELQRIDGIYTNKVNIAGRNGATTYQVGANLGTYLGSILIDETAGQVTCHVSYGQKRKWGVWNAWNQREVYLKAGDANDQTLLNQVSVGPRPLRNNSDNSLSTFCGLPTLVECLYQQACQTLCAAASLYVDFGIGVNSTTAMSGTRGRAAALSSAVQTSPTARYSAVATIGANKFTALESLTATGNNTTIMYGTESYCLLAARYPA